MHTGKQLVCFETANRFLNEKGEEVSFFFPFCEVHHLPSEAYQFGA